MSEVFEGVVLSASVAEQNLLDGTPVRGVSLKTVEVDSNTVVAFRSDPRQWAVFSSEMEEVASELSKFGSAALLVRYDSRVAYRSSLLFVDGKTVESYSEEDEEYVPLDELGEPITSEPPVKRSQLDPETEYETIRNAIQVGLRALGFGDWDRLYEILTQSWRRRTP